MAWLKRFSLHLAAAVGATGIFVAAAAVGASQTHEQAPAVHSGTQAASRTRTPIARRTPTPVVLPSTEEASTAPARAPSAVAPERSLSGTIRKLGPDGLLVVTVRGHDRPIRPDPGALIRLNGHATHPDSLQPGDRVVILGQAQGKEFLAHAITARRR